MLITLVYTDFNKFLHILCKVFSTVILSVTPKILKTWSPFPKYTQKCNIYANYSIYMKSHIGQ